MWEDYNDKIIAPYLFYVSNNDDTKLEWMEFYKYIYYLFQEFFYFIIVRKIVNFVFIAA